MSRADARVGSIANPAHYGARSLAVYENGLGFYFKLDGERVKLHGATKWIRTDGTLMRGRYVNDERRPAQHAQVEARGQPPQHLLDAIYEDELGLAISASLQDHSNADAQDDVAQENAPVPGDASQDSGAQDGDAPSDTPANGPRDCAICLSESANVACLPCFHCVSCAECARRLTGRPCPICRRTVRSVSRVYF